MSQDLLAEFSDFSVSESKQQNAGPVPTYPSSLQHNTSSLGDLTRSQPERAQETSHEADQDAWGQDDDDFGDFEVPEQDLDPTDIRQAPTKAQARTDKDVIEKHVNVPSGPPVTAKKATSARQLSSKHPFASNPDVLFDADEYDEYAEAGIEEEVEDEDEEDDFGDFETSEKPAPVPKPSTRQPPPPVQQQKAVKTEPQSATFDLLGLDSDEPSVTSNAVPFPATSKAVPHTVPRVTPETIRTTPRATTKHATQLERQGSVVADDDTWDDFETPQTTQSPPKAPPNEPPEIELPTDLLGDLTLQPSASGIAPSNIPPPSVLLTIFPPLLASLSQRFLHPLSTLSPSQKSTFLSKSETKTFLTSYVTLSHVLAHVIAGRKSRWKRDKHLAQSMRIGPSTSGRSGGMKLAGLDRSEAGREDTEVEDVLRVWREQVGRLKSTVAGAAIGKLAVPELAPVMPVRVAKGSEGAIVSTHACALCGLKREERVAKVDSSIEDSFGEWWIDGTNMHTICWNFWDMFKGRLSSR